LIENQDISVIIPTLDNPEMVDKVISKLNNQTLLPQEIIISDSSSGDEIENIIRNKSSKIKVVYFRQGRAYPFDRFIIKFKSFLFGKKSIDLQNKGRSYPYEASNLGAHEAKSEWLAFLDAPTIPNDSWLEDYCKIIKDKNVDIVFGVTKYLAISSFQQLLRASTYGR